MITFVVARTLMFDRYFQNLHSPKNMTRKILSYRSSVIDLSTNIRKRWHGASMKGT